MNKYIIPLILFLVSLAVFTYQSDFVGLEFKGDEAFYYQASRQMIDTNNWITPYYFKRPRFEKPPLYYWIVAGVFKSLGRTWQAARLPAALSMSIIILLIFSLGKELYNLRTGIASSLIMMSTLAAFRYARLILPEVFFLLLLCASVYLLFKERFFLAYVIMGLAMLTKGPVGIILPLVIIFGYRYSMGERGIFKKLYLAKGLITSLLISLPWFLLMIKIHGRPYIDHIFFRETIQRIGGLNIVRLFYFLPIIFIFCLPWSIFIIKSIANTMKRIRRDLSKRKGAVLSFVWFFSMLLFFTFIGEKHRHYMLSLMPPFSLMVGDYMVESFSSKRGKRMLILAVALFLSLFIFESAKLSMARETGGIGAFLSGRDFGIREEDYVGIGSHSIVPQEVEVNLNHAATKECYKWASKEEGDTATISNLNRVFLNYRYSYLVIKKKDYDELIWPKTKNRLTILAEGYMYNKDAKLGELLRAIPSLNKEKIFDIFREEVYFVTNKRVGGLR